MTVEATRVSIADGAGISGNTTGPGRGGSVTVRATDIVAISGPASGLSTKTGSSGTGGDITLHAPQIQLTDGASMLPPKDKRPRPPKRARGA